MDKNDNPFVHFILSHIGEFNAVLAIIIISLLIAVIFIITKQDNKHTQKVHWHKLVKNNYHLDYLTNKGHLIILDITIVEESKQIIVRGLQKHRLLLCIPISIKYQDFVEYIRQFEHEDREVVALVKGIVFTDELKPLKFNDYDLNHYLDFAEFLKNKIIYYDSIYTA